MHQLIEKWKVNKGLLASKMNMPLGTFCNKLNPKHSSSFNDNEIIRLKLILKDMGVELTDACDIDFNDVLKQIVK